MRIGRAGLYQIFEAAKNAAKAAGIDTTDWRLIVTDIYYLSSPLAEEQLGTTVREAWETLNAWVHAWQISLWDQQRRKGIAAIEPTWENQLTEARKLPRKELYRHASVSIGNSHRCRECFTCACATVLEELMVKSREC